MNENESRSEEEFKNGHLKNALNIPYWLNMTREGRAIGLPFLILSFFWLIYYV